MLAKLSDKDIYTVITRFFQGVKSSHELKTLKVEVTREKAPKIIDYEDCPIEILKILGDRYLTTRPVLDQLYSTTDQSRYG